MAVAPPSGSGRLVARLSTALVAAAVLLVATGQIRAWGDWYAISSPHRGQSRRLLEGRLPLSDDPRHMAHDLAWAQGGVQQVWGLGIPLWRAPFDALSGLAAGRPAGDKPVLGLFLALTLFALLQTWRLPDGPTGRPMARAAPSATALPPWPARTASVLVLAGFPPLIGLMRYRGQAYEDALIYGYFFACLLLCALVSLARRPRWRGFILLCALAGIGGLIRPTLVIYGLVTVLTATATVILNPPPPRSRPRPGLQRWRGWGGLPAGLAVFMLGGLLLWGTNRARFGDGFEFGHSLNVHDEALTVLTYSTRFDYPFRQEPVAAAAKELFGMLFLAHEDSGTNWFGAHLFPGQSPTIRWREIYLRTYDLFYLAVLLAGLGASAAATVGWLRRRRAARRKGGSRAANTARRAPPLATILGAWSLAATLLLALVYLRAPVLSSRYMLDFAPAFATATLPALWWLVSLAGRGDSRRSFWPILTLLAIGGLLASEHGRRPTTTRGLSAVAWADTEEARAAHADLSERNEALRPLPARYRSAEEAVTWWRLPYNGVGWDRRSDALAAGAVLFVADPEFLELDLVTAEDGAAETLPPDLIQARVGLESLERESIARTVSGWRVRFSGPTAPRYQSGVQVVFLATVDAARLQPGWTSWQLREVRWRARDGGASAETR